MFQPIAEFLSRFKKITTTNETTKMALRAAIKEAAGIEITPQKIFTKGQIAFIDTEHPSIKSNILLRKKEILSLVFKNLKNNSVIDIR